MSPSSGSSNPIEITETFVRLYVFLAQSLDRCLDKAQRESFPEKDHQAFLTETRSKLMELLWVNPVVKGKVEDECERILSLAALCLAAGPQASGSVERIKEERNALQIKLVALSDLLAVFRAI